MLVKIQTHLWTAQRELEERSPTIATCTGLSVAGVAMGKSMPCQTIADGSMGSKFCTGAKFYFVLYNIPNSETSPVLSLLISLHFLMH